MVLPTQQVKVERDGGWTTEFQHLRELPFDSDEYERLHALFFHEYDVIGGAHESRTRSRQTLRVTPRVTGRTVAIAEWPRLRQQVEALHKFGQHEEGLKHLRCLAEYMKRVNHATLPRIMSRGGDGWLCGR
jgi:hypothetical protein